MRRIFHALLMFLVLCGGMAALRAEEKLVLLDDVPRSGGRFEVAADGSRLYIVGDGKYCVYDAKAALQDRYGTPQGSIPVDLSPIESGKLQGWFIGFDSYAGSHVALHRPDGTEARALIKITGREDGIRGDGNWSSVGGGAIDAEHELLFVLDQALDGTGKTTVLSRIGVFDFDGKYVGSLNRYDPNAKVEAEKDPARDTFYFDVEVDPARQVCYATTRKGREMLAFRYDKAHFGELIGKVPGQGGIAVFPDGRVAVEATDRKNIQIYTPELQPVRTVLLEPALEHGRTYDQGCPDLEADAAGRLYANGGTFATTFARWSADLQTVELFGPRHQRLTVEWADKAIIAGAPFTVKAQLGGRPAVENPRDWQVLFRPSDGTVLHWQRVPCAYADGQLQFTLPAEANGLYDVVVRYGLNPIALADRANELYLQRTYAVLPAGITRSVAVITASCRRTFQQGEAIPVQVICREEAPTLQAVRVELLKAGPAPGAPLATATVAVNRHFAGTIPASLTRRLAPGNYQFMPVAEGYAAYALPIYIAAVEPDSPFQRILYHEFGNAPVAGAPGGDLAEKMSGMQEYMRVTAQLGFTRETDRSGGSNTNFTLGEQFNNARASVALPGFAPPEYYASTLGYRAQDFYFDQALRYGLRYDTQYVGHCGSPTYAEDTTRKRLLDFQRLAQWWGRYPAFYGFNYNDEMFNSGFDSADNSGWDRAWMKTDGDALKRVVKEQFYGKPKADGLNYALGQMYQTYNAAVRQVRPHLRLTTTPMWQFPAVEGSYPPSIYAEMAESFSHWMSEGYRMPFYPAHSAEFLKRPNLPMMGVFDNGFGTVGGDLYMLSAMQVAMRGMQGTGTEHFSPLGSTNKTDYAGASAFRVTNQMLQMYGPVFAQVPTANEGAVLYSYTQDITESRNQMGTPQWERVYEMYSAGLMAGIPMNILCEEDIRAGWLLVNNKPRVPMLFLVGLLQPLPTDIANAIRKYAAAGGKLFVENMAPPSPAKALEVPVPGTPSETLTVYDFNAANPATKFTTAWQLNVQHAACLIDPQQGANNSAGLVVAGELTNDNRAGVLYKIGDLARPVTPLTRLRYRLRADNELGRFLLVDLTFTDNTTLRTLSPVDRQGIPLDKDLPRGTVGQWVAIDARIGRWCAGKTVKAIAVGIDAVLLGTFKGAIDDVELYEAPINVREEANYAENLPGAVRLDENFHALKTAWNTGYSADSWWPLFQPVLEQHAATLAKVAGKSRRFPVDTNDPWITKNQFDGGAVRYVGLSTETSPYPWEAGDIWGLGTMYAKSKDTWLPKRVTMTLPATGGVIYDVFEHALVKPTVAGKTATLTADLTNFPARLYAVAPAPLGAPVLTVTVQGDTLTYQAQVVTSAGAALAARVPLRIRLTSAGATALEIYRGTGANGLFTGSVPVPVTARQWTLEVAELLGGKASAATITTAGQPGALLAERPAVDVQREAQLRALLMAARISGKMTLAMANDTVLPAELREALADALRRQGVLLDTASGLPKDPAPGLYLAAGCLPGNSLGALLQTARQRALFDWPITDNIPGPGRGLVTAIYGPRGYEENAIALVGGDAGGLAKAVTQFIAWLTTPALPAAKTAAAPAQKLIGKAVTATTDKLSDLVGVRLHGITATPDGARLVVTANGYQQNLALLEDTGTQAKVLRSLRVAQSPWLQSQFVGWGVGPSSGYLSPDGRRFGASGRTVARYGEIFQLIDAESGAQTAFPCYGDLGRFGFHHYAVTDDGNTVLAPGVYGVVCWKRVNGAWQEAWSYDYWKEFAKLDWPVSAEAERMSQFHAYVPRGADYAVIVMAETTDGGWNTPNFAYTARVFALNLADGTPRWTFDIPVVKTLLMPRPFTSPDGRKLLLQVQMGSWGKESFRFYSLNPATGAVLGTWDSTPHPLAAAVADDSGAVALVYENRLLEVRRPDGTLLYNQLWAGEPVSVAFTPDGQGLYVVDSLGTLARLDAAGAVTWQQELGCVSTLAVAGDRVYAAGWDGRVRAYTGAGQLRWVKNLTPELSTADPMGLVDQVVKVLEPQLLTLKREPTVAITVPAGENLLAGCTAGEFAITDTDGKEKRVKGVGNGKAILWVGGTGGWMSYGTIEVSAESLVNGKVDDVTEPWLNIDELFWAGQAGRQAWVQINFTQPTDVTTLTVYENPNQPKRWPTETLVQVWNDTAQRWDTADFGLFLNGPVATYTLNLKQVRKLRYVPWQSYYRNLTTSEIEVR